MAATSEYTSDAAVVSSVTGSSVVVVTEIDEGWLSALVAQTPEAPVADANVERLGRLLRGWADGFAAQRADVASPRLVWPRRGLGADEAGSFLRAVEAGIAVVDDGGYVTLPAVRPKKPEGRYALLARSGDGVSVNLEYLIQVGATAELVLDHGWPSGAVDFERGEFDALGRVGKSRHRAQMRAAASVRPAR